MLTITIPFFRLMIAWRLYVYEPFFNIIISFLKLTPHAIQKPPTRTGTILQHAITADGFPPPIGVHLQCNRALWWIVGLSRMSKEVVLLVAFLDSIMFSILIDMFLVLVAGC